MALGRDASAGARAVTAADIAWIQALNQRHARELSPLTRARLVALLAGAFHASAVDHQAAFLIAFDQDADYDSPNFLWFKARLTRFVYVDRVAVTAARRGQGLARTLYQDLFRRALARDHGRVVCEVNLQPPNPASDAFHASLGFKPMGEARLEARDKSVRYLGRDLCGNLV